MHRVVRSFRAIFVEGRFITLFGVIGFIIVRLFQFSIHSGEKTTISTNNYLWNPIAYLMVNTKVSFLVSTIFVFAAAWLLSQLNSRYNLMRSRSNLTLLTLLYLFSVHPYFLCMTGDWVALIFVLLAFYPLLESYQKPDSYLYSFRATILIGFASLFQIYALLLLPLWWRGERAMRGVQVRSFVSSLFGIFLIYISVFSLFLLFDDLQGFVNPFLSYASFSIPNTPEFSLIQWAAVLFIGLFFIVNMILAAKIYYRDKVLTLTFTRFLVYTTIILLLLQVVYWEQTLFFLLLAVLLIAYLHAYLLTRTQSKEHIILAYILWFFMILFYFVTLYPLPDLIT